MDQENPEVNSSERKGQKLLYKGFVFYKSRAYKAKTCWQCRLFKSKKSKNPGKKISQKKFF